MKLSDYVTIQDIAREHHLSYHVVYYRIKFRKVDLLKVGSQWFIRREDVSRVNEPVTKNDG